MAYFKRSFSRKADYVKDGKRFRYVGEGNGDHRLVRTAKDKAIRQERDRYYGSLPIPFIVAIHDNPRDTFRNQSIWSEKDVRAFWRYFDFNPTLMEDYLRQQQGEYRYAQARCHVSSLRQHRWLKNDIAWAREKHERREVVIDGYVYRPEASPGYVEYDRHTLAWKAMNIHNIAMAIAAFRNKSVTWYLKGHINDN